MIKKLPKEVIDKIAAGEIVQRPYSAIKEMVENSIDAGSTQISISLNNAGLDQIKISDNGSGIMKEDFQLLCERYATSKITEAKDLQSLQSFGFRGEALASISFVSELIILSKREQEILGYKGVFKDQKLLSLEPLGMSNGTEIIVTQLFNGNEKRRLGLNKSEEKKQVLYLIQAFSIHYIKIIFQLFYDQKNEFTSLNNRIEMISLIYKLNNKELIEKQFESNIYKFQSTLICSKLSSIKYKREFILFINNRYVECDSLRKQLFQTYQEQYLCIHDDIGGFFIYLSIIMDPKLVDPNVHPNKKLVRFINEQEISQEISQQLSKLIGNQNTQKYIQLNLNGQISNEENFRKSIESLSQKTKLRVDPKIRTLDEIFQKNNQQKIIDIKEQEFTQQINNNNEQDINLILQQLQQQDDINTKQFYQQMNFVGLLEDKQQLLVQVKLKLYHLNIIPLLFNMFILLQCNNNIQYICKQIIKQDNQLQIITLSDQQLNIELPQNKKDEIILIAEELSLIQHTNQFIKNYVIPYFKQSNIYVLKNDINQILNVEDLYKYFERC